MISHTLKEREEMKKKVLGEIEAIKVLEIQKTADLEKQEDERKKRELIEKEEKERRKKEEEEREKERKRVSEELTEARFEFGSVTNATRITKYPT